MWLPYCVLLPWFLRRNSGVALHRSYWFKFNVFIFWWVFLCTSSHRVLLRRAACATDFLEEMSYLNLRRCAAPMK